MVDPVLDDVGRAVIYHPSHGYSEKGIVTSFNERFVFVRYEKQHPTATGQATSRENLFWVHEPDELKAPIRL